MCVSCIACVFDFLALRFNDMTNFDATPLTRHKSDRKPDIKTAKLIEKRVSFIWIALKGKVFRLENAIVFYDNDMLLCVRARARYSFAFVNNLSNILFIILRCCAVRHRLRHCFHLSARKEVTTVNCIAFFFNKREKKTKKQIRQYAAEIIPRRKVVIKLYRSVRQWFLIRNVTN